MILTFQSLDGHKCFKLLRLVVLSFKTPYSYITEAANQLAYLTSLLLPLFFLVKISEHLQPYFLTKLEANQYADAIYPAVGANFITRYLVTFGSTYRGTMINIGKARLL